jgi:hypothetical protein
MMKAAASTFETSVNFYQTTQQCKPEDSHLQLSYLTTTGTTIAVLLLTVWGL